MPSAAERLVSEMLEFLTSPADTAAFQVIHSDLAGNVLFADEFGLPPAVIDISRQFRSVDHADAVLVADGVASCAPATPRRAIVEVRSWEPAA